jgi:MFS superfamily sulfate permease-like transporter
VTSLAALVVLAGAWVLGREAGFGAAVVVMGFVAGVAMFDEGA